VAVQNKCHVVRGVNGFSREWKDSVNKNVEERSGKKGQCAESGAYLCLEKVPVLWEREVLMIQGKGEERSGDEAKPNRELPTAITHQKNSWIPPKSKSKKKKIGGGSCQNGNSTQGLFQATRKERGDPRQHGTLVHEGGKYFQTQWKT